MDLGRMAVWLHPAVLRAANPLVPHWSTHDRPRAWTARPSSVSSGVRATAERERSGSGARAECACAWVKIGSTPLNAPKERFRPIPPTCGSAGAACRVLL